VCEWCSGPLAEPGALLCAACEEADTEMARAEWAAEAAEQSRQRQQVERPVGPLGDGGTAERPPF